MTSVKELQEVMVTEAQVTEGLVALLLQEQEAIVGGRPEELDGLVDKCEDLLQPMAGLEKERARLTELIISERGKEKKGTPATSRDLLRCLGSNDALLMQPVIERLRAASKEVVRVNNLNKPLLQHSQSFIRQTLRAATDDFKKNLIDKRM